jgi:hypothetical protein
LSPAHPAPSLGQVKKPLAFKLKVRADFTNKFLLQPGKTLAGDAMLPGDPGGRGMILTQKFRVNAQ